MGGYRQSEDTRRSKVNVMAEMIGGLGTDSRVSLTYEISIDEISLCM